MSISISGSGGVSNSALELVGATSWTTNTTSVSFTFDNTKYDSYLYYFWIDHNPGWFVTTCRFRNSSGDITSSYAWSSEWLSSAITAGTNTATFNGSTGTGENGGVGNTSIWLAGNGNGFDSHGFGTIDVPNTSTQYPWIRSNSTLIERVSGDNATYNEKSAGAQYSVTGNNITGITFKSSGGGASRRGTVTLIGIKRNP